MDMSEKTKEQAAWAFRILTIVGLGIGSTLGISIYNKFDRMFELVINHDGTLMQLRRDRDRDSDKIDKLFDIVWRIRVQQQTTNNAHPPLKEEL